VRVVEGNYDEYQLQLGRKTEEIPGKAGGKDRPKSGKAGQKSEKSPPKSGKQSKKSSKKSGKKRRFPFRKVSDLEDEIFIRETLVQEFQKELAQPETLRNGDKVRSITAKIAEEQEALKTLYEHWNEATELNW
jgi:ATP-binding cassette subfamily F protein 3